ncbi:glycosyltransferase family 4 protein [Sphingomonas sp.]|uniref:glycosyltransferase family 4 protein n=1 Tax=Sphingomonas sp. TaxID=28214 RepID=UPI0035BC667A
MTAPSHRPRILYLTQFFEPEGVFKGLEFAKALRERGFDVEVATGIPNYPFGKILPGYTLRPYRRETMDGIVVHRLLLYPSHDASTVRRSLNYLSFCASAFLFCLLRGRQYDAIYVYHPPMTVGFAAALAGVATRTPFIVDTQDLWPDSVTASGMSHGWIDRGLSAMCNFVYRRAARVVAQCAGMGAKLAERGAGTAKVRTIYNWADERAILSQGKLDLAPFGFDGRFTFLYGGNFGPHQALTTVVDAAVKAAAQEPAIQVLLVGGGLDEPRIAARIAEHATQAVRIVPGVPQVQVADVFAAADVLLVHLADLNFFEFTVPSKTQFYLASGKPILGGLVGEAAALIERAGAGRTVPPENPDALAAAMVALARADPAELRAMGERGARFYRERLSFARAMDDTAAAIREIA